MQSYKEYDKRDIYNKEIKPLMEEILICCRQHKIPIFMTCAVKNSDEKTEYRSEVLTPEPIEVRLKEDKIRRVVRAFSGLDQIDAIREEIIEF